MLRPNKCLTLILAMILMFSIAGCGTGKTDSAGEEGQKSGQEDTNPVPVIDVSLGMKPDEVVAEYEGGTLTAQQFEDYLRLQIFINPQYGLAIQQKDPQALKTLVESYVAEKTMANQETEIENAEEEADQWITQLKNQYLTVYAGDEKKVKQQMKDQGVTDQELKDFYLQYRKVEHHLSLNITDEKMHQKYEEEKKLDAFTLATVRHILVSVGEPATGLPEGKEPKKDEEAKTLAQNISTRLQDGEDFSKLAKEYSEDPGSKENGGLYEEMYVTQWVPEFKKAAVELPLDTISEPIKTDHGYHVMRVEKRHEQTYDEVKELIRGHIVNEEYTKYVENDLKEILKEEDIHLPIQPKE